MLIREEISHDEFNTDSDRLKKKENNGNDGGNHSDDSEFPAITMKRKDGTKGGSNNNTSRNNKKASLKKMKNSHQPRKVSTSSSRSGKKMTIPTGTAQKSSNKEMWTDKHAPKCTKDLCVAPKKIDEVKSEIVQLEIQNEFFIISGTRSNVERIHKYLRRRESGSKYYFTSWSN